MPNNLTSSCVLSINSSARTRQESFGILIASRTAPAVCLNEDAILVWNLCNGKNTLQTIVSTLVKNIPDGKKKEAEGKIISVITTLLNFNLLTILK